MKIDWAHQEEDDFHLEMWTTDISGVRLTITYVDDLEDSYFWNNNFTGQKYRFGRETSLEVAMKSAVESVLS